MNSICYRCNYYFLTTRKSIESGICGVCRAGVEDVRQGMLFVGPTQVEVNKMKEMV